jgi:hypothetical protein
MLVVWSSQGDECLGCIISRCGNTVNRMREIKYIQSDQPAWNPGGASATPQPRKFPLFDCAVALCTMQNALLVISNLTWLVNGNYFRSKEPTNVFFTTVSDSFRGAFSCVKTTTLGVYIFQNFYSSRDRAHKSGYWCVPLFAYIGLDKCYGGVSISYWQLGWR